MKRLVILGGGGHAGVLIELIRSMGEYEIEGILAPESKKGTQNTGVSVLGDDDLLPELYAKGIQDACIGVGSIRDNSRRRDLYEEVRKIGFSVPFLVHPQAIIPRHFKVSEGVQIMAGAVIQTNCVIGENTIINTGAIIEHDCRIGRDVHICPGAVISGECIIEDGAFIGAGVTIIQGIRVGRNALVAAGSVVIRDVESGQRVAGVPAK